jgi:H-type lectin domain
MGTTRLTKHRKDSKLEGTQLVEVQISPSSLPKIAIGLNMLDMNYTKFRMHTPIETVTENSFKVEMNTWQGAKLHDAGFSWLTLPTTSSRFQCGTFDTTSVRAWADSGYVHAWIQFPSAFSVTPNVFVGLTGFDLKDWHMRVRASDITKTGFNISLEGWGGTLLYTAQVQWIAFSPHQSGVSIGHFQGDCYKGWKGTAHFDKSFTKPPKIFTAFTRFDVHNGFNFRLDTILERVDTRSMDWHIRGWHDTRLYDVEVAYLALQV